MSPIPIAVVYAEHAPESANQEEPIEVLSDSEGEAAREGIPAQIATEGTLVGVEMAADASGNLGTQGLTTVPNQCMELEVAPTSQAVESAEASLEAGAETLLQLNQDVLVEEAPLLEAVPEQILTGEGAATEIIPEPEQNTGVADEEMADVPETANDGQADPEASRDEDQSQTISSASLVQLQV